MRTRPGRIANSSDRVKLDHYLSQYAFALAQAGAIVRNGGLNSNGQGNNNSGQANNSSGQSNGSNGQSFTQNNQPVQQQLATYLSMMRGLRDKIESVAGSANSNNHGNNAGNGISVTGGSSTTTGSQGTTTNSSTGSNSTGAAAATARPPRAAVALKAPQAPLRLLQPLTEVTATAAPLPAVGQQQIVREATVPPAAARIIPKRMGIRCQTAACRRCGEPNSEICRLLCVGITRLEQSPEGLGTIIDKIKLSNVSTSTPLR